MTNDAIARPRTVYAPVFAVILAGLIAGTIDIGAACLINGRNVPYILHVIAGGLLAARSFSGGLSTVLLGLALQELMSILIAAIYIAAVRLVPALQTRWIVGGIAYGTVVYVVMNYAVLPLSAWHNAPTFKWRSFLLNMAAMWLFGLIIAYLGSRTRFAKNAMSRGEDGPRLAASA